MRNFSCTNVTRFVSYSINQDEYVSTVDVQEVLAALSVAFESPLSHVSEDFTKIFGSVGDAGDFWPKLCASEFDVLMNLYDHVRHLGDKRPKGAYQHAENFVYVNLNTGASVVWTHVVC